MFARTFARYAKAIWLNYRETGDNGKYKYYELICNGPVPHKSQLGQHMEGDSLFYRRRTVEADNGDPIGTHGTAATVDQEPRAEHEARPRDSGEVEDLRPTGSENRDREKFDRPLEQLFINEKRAILDGIEQGLKRPRSGRGKHSDRWSVTWI